MPERSAFAFSASVGYTLPFNDLDDFNWDDSNGHRQREGEQVRSLDLIDTDSTLPLSERYFLGGLGRYQLRGLQGAVGRAAAPDPDQRSRRPLHNPWEQPHHRSLTSSGDPVSSGNEMAGATTSTPRISTTSPISTQPM